MTFVSAVKCSTSMTHIIIARVT